MNEVSNLSLIFLNISVLKFARGQGIWNVGLWPRLKPLAPPQTYWRQKEDAAVLLWESDFLKNPQKVLRPIDFIFQINSTRTAREGCLPKEDQRFIILFYERFPSRRWFLMAASLPSLQFRFAIKTCVFKAPLRRSSSHHKARHSQGVTPDAQPHRLIWPVHIVENNLHWVTISYLSIQMKTYALEDGFPITPEIYPTPS